MSQVMGLKLKILKVSAMILKNFSPESLLLKIGRLINCVSKNWKWTMTIREVRVTCWETNLYGNPQLLRILGQTGTALFKKPHYLGNDKFD